MSQDPHLNIFYGYGQGKRGNTDDRKALEDNVTKAFISVLKHADPSLTEEFLKEMLCISIGKKNEPLFDLQSLESDSEIEERMETAVSCYMLGISPSGKVDPKPSNKAVEKVAARLDRRDSISLNLAKRLQTTIKGILDGTGEDEIDEGHCRKVTEVLKELGCKETDAGKFTRNDLDYLCQLTQGSRPDAWIAYGDVIVVIENKIWGDLYRPQLERHKSQSLRKRGKERTAWHECFLSWKCIYQFFKKQKSLDRGRNDVTAFLIEQFIQYLEELDMVGFDGIPFTRAKPYTPGKGRKVLRNLLDEIKDDVVKIDESLKPSEKIQKTRWDYFGSRELHFTVYVTPDEAAVDLYCDVSILKRLRRGDGVEWLCEEVERLQREENPRRKSPPESRYWISAASHKILDRKKGQMKGPEYVSQCYQANIADLIRLRPPGRGQKTETWRQVVRYIWEFSAFCKHLAIGKRFYYESQEDRELLSDASFKDQVVAAIKELYPLYRKISESKKGEVAIVDT